MIEPKTCEVRASEDEDAVILKFDDVEVLIPLETAYELAETIESVADDIEAEDREEEETGEQEEEAEEESEIAAE